MVFEKNSTRTRVSFEAGMAQLGYTAQHHGSAFDTLCFKTGADTARLAARAVELGDLFFRGAEHAGQLNRLALIRRRLHGERFEQLILHQQGAHFFGACQIGLVFEQQFLPRFPLGG